MSTILSTLTSSLRLGGSSSQPSPPIEAAVPSFNPPADGRFPVPRPSLSYWLQGVRANPLLNHRSTEELPEKAEVVIIGSGMSGALVAYSLLKGDNPPKSINAGHCKPDQWRGYAKYEKRFGSEQARKILDNEWETYSNLVAFVKKEKIDCDLWTGTTMDVAVGEEVSKAGQAAFEAYKLAGGDVSRVVLTTDKEEAARISRIKSAEAVWSYPAASFYPWKVVAHLLNESLPLGLNLQTHTTVTSITSVSTLSSTSPLWSVDTKERGSIITPKVVHATNAFVSTLLPLLDGRVDPQAFMCTKVVPPPSFSGSETLQNSMGVMMPGGSLFSINPRSSTDGILLFGGDNPGYPQLSKLFASNPELKADDRLSDFVPIQDAIADFTSKEFEGWGSYDDMSAGEGIDYSWSGVLGMSLDGVPWIGRVPEKEGLFVIAGHNGHGMARIFTAAPALARLISDPELEFKETRLPDVYELTEERLTALKSSAKAARGHGFST